MKEKCCYKNCDKDATVKGFVFAMNTEGGKDIPTDVFACDKHKKLSGFFEYIEEIEHETHRHL